MALFFKNPSAQIEKMQLDSEAAGKISDPLARLRAYDDILHESARLKTKIDDVTLNLSAGSVLTGLASGMAGWV